MSSLKHSAPIIVLVGPTAIGKTELALAVAAEFGCEIVNMDSMQVYRYMDIGTAKPTRDERKQVRHHLLDIVDPDQSYDAAAYCRDARRVVEEISSRKKIPLVTGGTGLYLRAFLDGIFEISDIPEEIRKRLKKRLEDEGRGALFAELRKLDPDSAARIHPHDSRRLLRGLEIVHATGIPWSVHLRKWQESNHAEKRGRFGNVLQLALSADRSLLYERINRRTRQMMKLGFLEEVEKLLQMGYGPELKPMQAIGYRHLVQYTQGEKSWSESIDLLARDTRRYAKRQFTWFRHQAELEWFPREKVDEIKDRINSWLSGSSGGNSRSRERTTAAAPDLPRPLLSLLARRGITDQREINDFLHPRLTDLPSPFLMKDMEKATDIFLDTLRNNNSVVIYGDYDVDGISSTALLATFFRCLNIGAGWYLPNRLTDGYGLHVAAIEKLAATVKMPALLITVDCGITANREIEAAKKLGFTVIVTDHHLPPEELPAAHAILNPKQGECSFPFDELAGVGVAFFFLIALRSKLVENGYWSRESAPNLKDFLDLVALGTIADVMPLVKTNRILVRAGLEVLAARSRPGLWALCECAGLGSGRISAEDISFRLAPRINAAGRMGNPDLAVELLLCKTSTAAVDIAETLEKTNTERREIAARALEEALGQGKRRMAEEKRGALVLNHCWHAGIVGIVAAQLADVFQVPVIIFAEETKDGRKSALLKGSGRSVPGIDLYEKLQQCDELIEQYGGHRMAAGLVIKKENLADFTLAFCQSIEDDGSGQEVIPNSGYPAEDYRIRDGDIFEEEFLDHYLKMEPFGEGNPEPVFRLDHPHILNVTVVKDHLKFSLCHNNRTIGGIGFGMGDRHGIASASPATMYFKLRKNSFRGVQRWEIQVVAIAQHSDFS